MKRCVLVVDGYNIIGDWPELQRLKERNLADARDRLIEQLAEYRVQMHCRVIIVFDAYMQKGIESKYNQHQLEIVYTRENETADERIEKLVIELLDRRTQVYVATSDYVEQRVIFAQGALRKSARELQLELEQMNETVEKSVRHKRVRPFTNRLETDLSEDIKLKLERMRRGEEG